MKRLFLLSLFATPLLAQPQSDFTSKRNITRVMFGSCNHPKKQDTSIYEAILQKKPDLFIFVGDNIYGDTEDMAVLKKKYSELGATDGFRKLKEATQILATWDDHDYGVNDGGRTYPMRRESQQVFLDFFEEPKNSVRRSRPGIYTSYSFGEEGKTVQIILLDTRYFKDPAPKFRGEKRPHTVGWYEPMTDTNTTLLGETQWKWLEEQLQVKADVRILVSSIQVLAHEKGMENWGVMPHEQQRLFDLLKKYKANRTVAISGDVHFTELSRVMISDYPFYDLTSSGMSHTSAGWARAHNSFRVGRSYAERNAGLIEINWEKSSLRLQSINNQGKNLVEHEVSFRDLEFGE